MRLLLLGGSAWLGRTTAAVAVGQGHEVTCLARGDSGEVPGEARFVRADRDRADAYDGVAGERWDAVIDVAGPPEPVTVSPDAPLDDVVRQFIDSRGSSVLVIDDDDRPVGRILADDLIDALVPDRGKVRFLRLRG